MHQEKDPHPHPHPGPVTLKVLPWLLIAALAGAAVFLALYGPPPGGNEKEGSAAGAGDGEVIAIFNEGVSFLEQYDYEPAYQRFLKVLESRPGWDAAHFNAGLAALNIRKDENRKIDYIPIAEERFREALRLNPNNLHAKFSLGVLLKHLRRLDEAFDAFQAVARADPGDPFALYEYGVMLADMERYREAKVALEAAVSIQPALASALYRLALVVYRNLEEMEKVKAARDEFKKLKDANQGIMSGVKYGEAGKYLSAIRDPYRRERPGSGVVELIPADSPTRSFGGPAVARSRPDGEPSPPALAVGDLDGDLILDVVLCAQPGDSGPRAQVWKGRGGEHMEFQKSSDLDADGAAAALGDLDGDGDLDLVLADVGAIRLYENDGQGGLGPSPMKIPPAARGFPVQVLVLDADADWDLDILVARQVKGEEGIETSLELFNNNRDGSFQNIAGDINISPLPLTATNVLYADLDGDIDLDILVLARPREKSLVLINDRAWRYRRAPAGKLGGVGELLSRSGLPPLVRETLSREPAAGMGALSIALIADSSGRPLELRARAGSPVKVGSAGPAPASWIGLDLLGKKNPKVGVEWSNLSGIGSTVEVRFGGEALLRQVTSNAIGAASGPHRLHLDLNGARRVDYLRILWPDGVLQSEPGLSADRLHRIEEKQRKPTSCPIVFAWNGTRFQFVADFLGVGGLGYLERPGIYSKPDPTEVLELPEIRPVENAGGSREFRISILETLEECAYLDAVELVAVDCPGGITVHPQELFPVRAPAPEATLLSYRRALLPDRVTDLEGRDVTPALRRLDGVFGDTCRRDPRFPGAAGLHGIILEWERGISASAGGPESGPARPVLFLHGYVEYSYSTSNFAAAQANVVLHAPTISAERDGQWVPLREEWGFPAGTPRWMAVDLGGLLRDGDRRLRIETDMEIYWDQAFLAAARPLDLGEIGGGRVGSRAFGEIRVTTLIPDSAELRFRGFPRDDSRPGSHLRAYDYHDVSPREDMKPFPGNYTRYGAVQDLLSRADDRLAILGEGDEVMLGFRAARLPPLPAGHNRTFFLAAVGYCKDMDLYTAASGRIEPLPFRGMSRYPPPEGETPPGGERAAGRAARNTRVVEPLTLGGKPGTE